MRAALVSNLTMTVPQQDSTDTHTGLVQCTTPRPSWARRLEQVFHRIVTLHAFLMQTGRNKSTQRGYNQYRPSMPLRFDSINVSENVNNIDNSGNANKSEDTSW
jgi:hypothetical protein